MEVLTHSILLYAEKSRHCQEKPVMESVEETKSDCDKHTKQGPLDEKSDCSLAILKGAIHTMQCEVQNVDGEAFVVEESANGSCCSSDLNGPKLTRAFLDHGDDSLEEQVQYKDACLDFQNSHVDVNTIDSEPLSENKEEELSISASKWPEQGESLALWVKVWFLLYVFNVLHWRT